MGLGTLRSPRPARSARPAPACPLQAGEPRPFPSVDVSFAVATDKGLITPIVKAAAAKGLLATGAEVRALALKAREGKLKPEVRRGCGGGGARGGG